MENKERAYYQARTRFNGLLAAGQGESSESAALFYYLNRTGYNGLCRFNSRGEFNVPFGRYVSIGYVSEFSDTARLLARWQFTCGDVEAVRTRSRRLCVCRSAV